MDNKIVKESYLLAPFEEEKTSQSDVQNSTKQPIMPLNFGTTFIDQKIGDQKSMLGSESPSPIKKPGFILISFDIKHHEILKKEDYVVSI